MKKLLSLLLIMITCSVGIAHATGESDTETVTSLKYVTDELNTRQDKFGANDGKAMTFTNAAGGNAPRDVKESLGTSTSDNGLPTVSAVNTGLDDKQNTIPAVNTNTVVTYTGVAGTVGQKGIYQDTGTYATQSDNLIQASTFNAALRNGLENEFVCADRDPVSNQCWLWTIDNDYNGTTVNYISATGTGYQNGTPTPTNPIYPVFYRQGNMILRRVGDYADSYDATTHKITRNVGVKVLDGTETGWSAFTSGIPESVACYQIQFVGCVSANNSQFGMASTHFRSRGWSTNFYQLAVGDFKRGGSTAWMYFCVDASIDTVDKFKAYLADQYANGTPVTIWYPLATPVEEDWTDTTYNTSVYIPQNQ